MMPNLDAFDRVSVLIVGDVMLDRYLWGDIHRISPEAPVPIVEIDRETHTAGGAANVANNLVALGVKCELFGVVGNDAPGQELQALLRDRQVAFDPRLVRAAASTITKTRIVAQRQQLCRLDRESDPEAYAISEPGLLELLAEKAARYNAIIISDYAKGVINQAVLDTLRRVRTERGTFLALDPKPQRPLDVGGFDLLTPNYSEGFMLSGLSSHSHKGPPAGEVAAAILQRHHPKNLVMTLGAGGMLLQSPGGPARHFPTMVRQVADVSGAGDTVISTLAVAIAAGLAPDTAVEIANAAAGVVVGKLGTATVTRAELMAAMAAAQPGDRRRGPSGPPA